MIWQVATQLWLVLAGGLLHVDPTSTLDERAVLARYAAECQGKVLTDSCRIQRRLVEGVYYRSFRRLTASRKKGVVDRKYMVAAANAEFPALRELGLWTLAWEGSGDRAASGTVRPDPDFLSEAEKKLYVAELNSPYPALRKVAWDALRIDDSSAKLDETKFGVDRDYRETFGMFEPGAPRGLVADRPPNESLLMAVPYPGAQILYYASGKGGAIYLTDDSFEQVEAFYHDQGLASTTAENILANIEGFMQARMREIIAKMESGADPVAMQREMEGLQTLMQESTPGFLFGAPADTKVVGAAETVADQTFIHYQAVIWKARDLGKTGIAIPFKE